MNALNIIAFLAALAFVLTGVARIVFHVYNGVDK